MFRTSWPKEHDDALRELVTAPDVKYSFGAIADLLNERFKTNYSRNATIGRANRLGLERVKRKRRKRYLAPDEKIKIAARSNLPERYLAPTIAKIACDEPIIEASIGRNEAGGVPLIEVEGCRWPSGDGVASAFTFCNAAKMKGCSYCAGHWRLARRAA